MADSVRDQARPRARPAGRHRTLRVRRGARELQTGCSTSRRLASAHRDGPSASYVAAHATTVASTVRTDDSREQRCGTRASSSSGSGARGRRRCRFDRHDRSSRLDSARARPAGGAGVSGGRRQVGAGQRRRRRGRGRRSRSRQLASAAARPVELVAWQAEEPGRAAPRVPGEGWGHSAAGAGRVGRRTCRLADPDAEMDVRNRRAPHRRDGPGSAIGSPSRDERALPDAERAEMRERGLVAVASRRS